MNVAYGPVELKKFLEEAARVSQVSLISYPFHTFYRYFLFLFFDYMYSVHSLVKFHRNWTFVMACRVKTLE